MSILSWNCANGLKFKIDSVKVILNKYAPDLAFIHESEIKDGHLGPCSVQGYEIFCPNTLDKFGKARMICYKKNNSVFKHVALKENVDLLCFECSDIKIFGLYRGFKIPDDSLPKIHFEKYLHEIEQHLNTSKDVAILGDFNIDPVRDVNKWNGKALNDWAIKHALKQHVKGNTRERTILKSNGQYALQKSKIDLIYSKDIIDIKVKKDSDYLSDHSLIIADLLTIPKPNVTRKFAIRDLTKLSEFNILRKAFTYPGPQSLHEINLVHQEIYHELAPTRIARTRSAKQLINPRIEKVKKKEIDFTKSTKQRVILPSFINPNKNQKD